MGLGMPEKVRPGGGTLIFLIFCVMMLAQSLSFRARMAPVWFFQSHPEAAASTLQDCQARNLTQHQCYEAYEALHPSDQRPAIVEWLNRIRGR
ncbi:MAG: hypothetical protein NVSMB31_07330 [Vulcanimicrobiaceae bacterium]